MEPTVAFSNDDNGIDTGQTKVYFWDGVSWYKEEVILMELQITIVVMMLELMRMEPYNYSITSDCRK